MKKVSSPVIIAAGLLILIVGLTNQYDSSALVQGAAQQYAAVVKINDNWVIADPQDSTIGNITLSPGEIINWIAGGTNAYFQFSDKTLFGGTSYTLQNGDTLTLTVNVKAKPGNYGYSVFCTADQTFANPEAPPEIIIIETD